VVSRFDVVGACDRSCRCAGTKKVDVGFAQRGTPSSCDTGQPCRAALSLSLDAHAKTLASALTVLRTQPYSLSISRSSCSLAPARSMVSLYPSSVRIKGTVAVAVHHEATAAILGRSAASHNTSRPSGTQTSWPSGHSHSVARSPWPALARPSGHQVANQSTKARTSTRQGQPSRNSGGVQPHANHRGTGARWASLGPRCVAGTTDRSPGKYPRALTSAHAATGALLDRRGLDPCLSHPGLLVLPRAIL
jgi:hypothetical protein